MTISLGTVLMAVSLIRRSRTQLASAAASSGAFVSTLATADRLFWLEDHAAAEAAAGRVEPRARDVLRDAIELRRGDLLLSGHRAARPRGVVGAVAGRLDRGPGR